MIFTSVDAVGVFDPDDAVLARLRTLCLALPETSEAGSWGHPNFRAGKRTFVAYEIIDTKPSIAFRLEPAEVSEFLTMKGFFPTPYGRGAWVSLDASGSINWRLVDALIEKSYRVVALKRMIDGLDGTVTPEAELRSFIQRLDPKDQKLMRSVRAALRRRFPTANELAYDYSSHVVISYSPTDRAIDSIVAIAGRADGVRLYLMHGPQLPDPKGLLLGSGRQTRFLPVGSASRLAHPDVKALMAGAVERSISLPSKGKGRLIIKSSAAKRRPR